MVYPAAEVKTWKQSKRTIERADIEFIDNHENVESIRPKILSTLNKYWDF